VAIWTVTCSDPTIVLLLLYLWMKLGKLNLIIAALRIVALHVVALHRHLLTLLYFIHDHGHLLIRLFKLCLTNLKLFIDPGYLTLFLIKNSLQFLFQFLLIGFKLVRNLKSNFFFLFFELFNLFIEDLNVEFELLLHFDMVSDFGLILLELLLVLLWW
jgi:hypothetical protein